MSCGRYVLPGASEMGTWQNSRALAAIHPSAAVRSAPMPGSRRHSSATWREQSSNKGGSSQIYVGGIGETAMPSRLNPGLEVSLLVFPSQKTLASHSVNE